MAENHNPYPTRYSNDNDVAVYSLFRSENWFSLTPNERADALQELANRSARDNHTQAAKVSVEPMEGSTLGYFRQSDGQVHVNFYVVNHGVLKYTYQDENGVKHQAEQPLPAVNLRVMTNIYHEDWHSAQHASKDNPNVYGADVLAQKNAQANIHHYITPGIDHDLYRIQQLEREANDHAYEKTLAAMRATERYYGGKEAALDAYEGSIPASYRNALSAAQKHYDDPHIESTMTTAMNDSYYGNGYISKHQADSYYRIRLSLVAQKMEQLKKAQESSDHPERYHAAIAAMQHSQLMLKAEQKSAAEFRHTHQGGLEGKGMATLRNTTGISGMSREGASIHKAAGLHTGTGSSGTASLRANMGGQPESPGTGIGSRGGGGMGEANGGANTGASNGL